MWSRPWVRLVLVLLLLAATGLSAWVWLNHDLEMVSWIWGIIGGSVSLLLILREAQRNDRRLGERGGREQELFHRLGDVVAQRSAAEGTLRSLEVPYPLPVSWRTADEDLQPSWRAVCRSSDGVRLDLDGRDDMRGAYLKVPSRRMLAVGPAGSGKSVLALRLVHQLVRHRSADDPIPVLLQIASWSLTTEVTDWIVGQVLQQHPALREEFPDAEVLVRGLVDTGRILPVADGLDEAASEAVAAAFLAAWNAREAGAVFLTCRLDYYRRHLAQGDKLRAAAVIMLEPLDTAVVTDYLSDALSQRRRTLWAPVLDRLAPGEALGQALSTPLMVSAAHMVFEHTTAEPFYVLELADRDGAAEVEDWLLREVVSVAEDGSPQPAPDAVDHRKVPFYLAFLAGAMSARGRDTFVWWRLPAEVPVAVWGLAGAVAACLAVSIADDHILTFVGGFTWRGGTLIPVPSFDHPVIWLLVGVLGAGLVAVNAYRSDPPERLVYRGTLRPSLASVFEILVLSLLVGVAYYVALREYGNAFDVATIADWLAPHRGSSASDEAVVVAVLVLAIWAYELVARAVQVDFHGVADRFSADRPEAHLAADRNAMALEAFPLIGGTVAAVVVACALLTPFSRLEVPPLEEQIAAGVAAGALGWLIRAAGRTWVLVGLAQGYFAATRRLPPVTLPTFLRYVTAAGLLRNDAGNYRFLHGRLQHQLAAADPGPPAGRARVRFAEELADSGFPGEAYDVATVVFAQRRLNGLSTELIARSARTLVYAGCLIGLPTVGSVLLDTRLRDELRSSAGDGAYPIGRLRAELSAAIAQDASLDRLRGVGEQLAQAERRARRSIAGTDEFLAVVRYAQRLAAEPDAAAAALEAEYADLRPSPVPMPVLAAILTRLRWRSGQRMQAHELCWDDAASLRVPDRILDLDRLLETWAWTAAVHDRFVTPAEVAGEVAGDLPLDEMGPPGRSLVRNRLTTVVWYATETDPEFDPEAFSARDAVGRGAVWVWRVLAFQQPPVRERKAAAERVAARTRPAPAEALVDTGADGAA